MSTPQLPAYKSHKTVRAAKITEFRQNGNPDMPDLVLGDIDCIVSLLTDWHQKHKPEVGGYLVQYEDGYLSYSPAKAFEEGYTAIQSAGQLTQSTTDKEKQIQATYYLEKTFDPQDEQWSPKDEDAVSALVTAAHYLIQSMFNGPKPENYDSIMELADAHIALDAAREKVYLAEIKLGIDVT